MRPNKIDRCCRACCDLIVAFFKISAKTKKAQNLEILELSMGTTQTANLKMTAQCLTKTVKR